MTSEAAFQPVDRALIVGCGLMGGSLGLALQARRLATHVVGFDTNPIHLESALSTGAITDAQTNLERALPEADLVVLAAPVSVIPDMLHEIARSVRAGSLVTDLGSVKSRIAEAGAQTLPHEFVPGHPMAGGVETGPRHSRSELFLDAAWAVISPDPKAPTVAANRLAALASALGSRPIFLTATEHDRLVGLVSHLPHALSFAFAATLDTDPAGASAHLLGGGSYRDLMRVSRADEDLWRGIFAENRTALLAALDQFEVQLARVREAIESSTPSPLESTA